MTLPMPAWAKKLLARSRARQMPLSTRMAFEALDSQAQYDPLPPNRSQSASFKCWGCMGLTTVELPRDIGCVQAARCRACLDKAVAETAEIVGAPAVVVSRDPLVVGTKRSVGAYRRVLVGEWRNIYPPKD